MARIQILELPEGSSDDRPPFVLVVDEYQPSRYIMGPDQAEQPVSEFEGIAEKIGARSVLVFVETVDIPANDVPVDEDGHPLFLKVHVEGKFEKFREQAEEEIRSIQGRMTTSLGVDNGELAEAVQDALGITPGSGPDNIAGWLLTACRELKKSEAARAHLREERAEARQWARHGYEIGQRHCGWTDHGVAPAWLTEGWPPHIDSCEHLQQAAEYDTALTRVRGLPEQPEAMDAQHGDPSGYLHGYGIAIREAKRASYPPQAAESGDTERSPEE